MYDGHPAYLHWTFVLFVSGTYEYLHNWIMMDENYKLLLVHRTMESGNNGKQIWIYLDLNKLECFIWWLREYEMNTDLVGAEIRSLNYGK